MPHRLTWEKPGSSDEVFRHLIVMALNRSAVAAVMETFDSEFLYVANLPDCWSVTAATETLDSQSLFGETLGARLAEAKCEAIAKQSKIVLNEMVSGERFFEFTVEIVPVGGRPYFLTTIAELTDERRREQMLRALLREVSHRSKNLLAIILSIASQTAKGSPALPAFLTRFRGRLFSLSQSQDLVTDSSWRGARLRALAIAQAQKYTENAQEVFLFEGIDPLLDPNQALHIGLALHELFVDALRRMDDDFHSFPSAMISCRRFGYGDVPGFELVWRSLSKATDGGLKENADEFHSTVLNRLTPLAVGGEAVLNADTQGISYVLRFPENT